VAESLAASQYAVFHPEADVASCTPEAVIKDLAELAGVVGT